MGDTDFSLQNKLKKTENKAFLPQSLNLNEAAEPKVRESRQPYQQPFATHFQQNVQSEKQTTFEEQAPARFATNYQDKMTDK